MSRGPADAVKPGEGKVGQIHHRNIIGTHNGNVCLAGIGGYCQAARIATDGHGADRFLRFRIDDTHIPGAPVRDQDIPAVRCCGKKFRHRADIDGVLNAERRHIDFIHKAFVEFVGGSTVVMPGSTEPLAVHPIIGNPGILALVGKRCFYRSAAKQALIGMAVVREHHLIGEGFHEFVGTVIDRNGVAVHHILDKKQSSAGVND